MILESKGRKIGDSMGVILPKEILAEMKLREGDPIFLSESIDGSIHLTPHDPAFTEQMATAESVIRRYPVTLRELAK